MTSAANLLDLATSIALQAGELAMRCRAEGVTVAVVEVEPDPATWTALAGVVFNPTMDECFSAASGQGATLNGAPLRVAPAVDLAQAQWLL